MPPPIATTAPPPMPAAREALLLRPARRGDATDLARLGNLAGAGLPAHLWQRTAAPGQDPFEIGVQRAERDNAEFSWRNAAMAEVDGVVAGAVVSYPLAAEPVPVDDLPPLFRPLQELENAAGGSQYVNIIAVYPAFRRRGIGWRLLEEAARRAGPRRLSLVVADRNATARQLYDAFGFRVAGERPMVKEDWESPSTSWVLMVRPARG